MASPSTGARFALIAAVCGASVWAWSPSKGNLLGKIPPGLDLAGGAELVYRVRAEDLPEEQRGVVLEKAADVVRLRLGNYKEAKVAPYGSGRLLVQMPHADQSEVERLKSQVEKSGRLEWRMVIDERCDRREIHARARRNREKGLPPPPGTRWYQVRNTQEEILVDDKVEMTGEGIDPTRISLEPNPQTFRDDVGVKFTPEGDAAFNRMAKKSYRGPHDSDRVAVILNDVRAVPTEEERQRDATASGRIVQQGTCYNALGFNSPTFSGGASITGIDKPEERQDLIDVLRTGSLPAPLELEHQMSIGPSLGEDQMQKGLKACLWGTALVLVFMCGYYLLSGAVASFALLLNLLVLLGIMGGLGATLTLPGMAGVVLTLGMAVDANILIFERIREELKAGKGTVPALAAGYERAFVTILDSHLTSIITAVVLYALGSQQVKGFAVTLALGLAASMFTSLVVTRAFFDLFLSKGWMKGFRMAQLFPATALDFVKASRWCILGSVVLIAGGLANLFLVQGRSLLAVDFTGGRILQLRFAEGKRLDEVRNKVGEALKSGGYPYGDDAQVQSLRMEGESRAGLPTSFEIVTRNLDTDADRVRAILKTVLGPGLKTVSLPMAGAFEGSVALDLAFTAPTDGAKLKADLGAAGLKGVEVETSGPLAARVRVPRRGLVDDLRAAFGTGLAATAFRVEPEKPRRTTVVCAVRDLDEAGVRARLESDAVNLKGCAVRLGPAGERGVAPLTIESPLPDAEEVKKRLLRHFGPELCTQDVPFAKVYPDGSCDVEIRLSAPLTMGEFAARRDEVTKGLELQLGSSGKVTEHDPPEDLDSVKAVVVNYSKGPKDLMQYLFLLRQPNSRLPLVEPFQKAETEPATVRLTFSLLTDKPGLEPAKRAAKESGGILLDGALNGVPGGFQATMTVPEDRLAKARSLLREGYAQALSDPIPRDDVVGGVVAGQAVQNTLWALVFSWAALIVYIAFRFEFISGVAAVVAIVHDVAIVLGVIAFTHTPIDLTIIAALLTIIGFSVNDTIVIFDRIRENLGGRWDVTATEFGRVVNLSVNQTLSRTILTSFTVLISVVALFMGGEVFRGFAVAMLAGVITGTYSTIYIAAPLVQMWRKRQDS